MLGKEASCFKSKHVLCPLEFKFNKAVVITRNAFTEQF